MTLAEAKDHLRVDDENSDAYIQGLIKVASDYVERIVGRTLINTQYSWKMDSFPCEPVLRAPRPPLRSVDSITYVDQNGTTQTWGSTYYLTDTVSQPGRITPAYLESWPTNVRGQMNAVTVTYTAGYGASPTAVPETIRQAILLLVGHWYENRQDVVVGVTPAIVPQQSQWLVESLRLHNFEGY